MAGVICSVSNGASACTAATPKTVVQLVAPTNQRLRVLGFDIAFDGVSATDIPAAVKLLRQTTAGTMTAGTVRKINDAAETPQTTSQINSTVNPTAGDILEEHYVHQQGGLAVRFPEGQEHIIAGGGRWGIEVTAGTGSPNCHCTVIFEE